MKITTRTEYTHSSMVEVRIKDKTTFGKSGNRSIARYRNIAVNMLRAKGHDKVRESHLKPVFVGAKYGRFGEVDFKVNSYAIRNVVQERSGYIFNVTIK